METRGECDSDLDYSLISRFFKTQAENHDLKYYPVPANGTARLFCSRCNSFCEKFYYVGLAATGSSQSGKGGISGNLFSGQVYSLRNNCPNCGTAGFVVRVVVGNVR